MYLAMCAVHFGLPNLTMREETPFPIYHTVQNPSRHGYSHIIIFILAENIRISENVSEHIT